MNKLEQELCANIDRWHGKKSFGNTKIFRKTYSMKFVSVKIDANDVWIFAKTENGKFWADPFNGKNKVVNSRLSALKEYFPEAVQIKPEVLCAMRKVANVGTRWLRANNLEVKRKNNAPRFFKTRKGADDYIAKHGGTLTIF